MADGPIVCNTGPLIALSMVGQLELLKHLYERVVVPDVVIREVMAGGSERPGFPEIPSASWLERVHHSAPEPLLAFELGAGESAVIATAHRMKARLVLIDERRARRIAEQAYGFRVKGSAGILVSAKRAGLVPAVGPLLEEMARQGYFLSRRLLHRALLEAGETPSDL